MKPIEHAQPDLAGRVDALQIALVTILKARPIARFEASFLANAQTWKGSLIATSTPEAYLDQFDSQVTSLLNLLR